MRKIIYSTLILIVILSSFSFYSINRKRQYDELEMKYKRMGCSLYHERVLEDAPQWVQALNYKLFGKSFAEFDACSNLTQEQLEEVVEFTKLTDVDLFNTRGLDLKALTNCNLKKLSLRFSRVNSLEALKEFDLEYLDVAASNFTDLTLIQHMNNLKTLVVVSISPKEKLWMQEHLPQCKISIAYELHDQIDPEN